MQTITIATDLTQLTMIQAGDGSTKVTGQMSTQETGEHVPINVTIQPDGSYTTHRVQITRTPDRVTMVNFNPKSTGVFSLQDAIEVIVCVRIAIEGIPGPVLMELNGVKMHHTARSFMGGTEAAKWITCCALVTGSSPLSRLSGFFSSRGSVIPTRTFGNKEEGLDWLRTYRKAFEE